MSQDNPMSPIHRFKHLQSEGSPQFRSDAPGPLKQREWSWLNLDHNWQRKRTEGAEDAELGQSEAKNYRDREQHRDEVYTQSAKYAHEVQRTMVDQELEKRAQRFLSDHECSESIAACSAVEVITYFYNDTLMRMKRKVKVKHLRRKSKEEIITMFDRSLSKVRTIVFGPQYTPKWHDAEQLFY